MTTITTTPTTAHEESSHPTWCELGPECKREKTDWSPRINPEHHGHVTTFHPEWDDVKVTLYLEHSEDIHPTTGVDGSRTVVGLALSNGCAPDVDVRLTPRDARFLARQLEDYARRAKHDAYWMSASFLAGTPVAHPPTVDELKSAADALGIKPSDIARKAEDARMG